MNREQTHIPSFDEAPERATWERPHLSRLEAGDAELNPGVGGDALSTNPNPPS